MSTPLNSAIAADLAKQINCISLSQTTPLAKAKAFHSISSLDPKNIPWGFTSMVLIYGFNKLEDQSLKDLINSKAIEILKLSDKGFCENLKLITSAEKVNSLFIIITFIQIQKESNSPADHSEKLVPLSKPSIERFEATIQLLWKQYQLDEAKISHDKASPESSGLTQLKELIETLKKEIKELESKVGDYSKKNKAEAKANEENRKKIEDLEKKFEAECRKKPKNFIEALAAGIGKTITQETGCEPSINLSEFFIENEAYTDKEKAIAAVAGVVGAYIGSSVGGALGAAGGTPLGPPGEVFGLIFGAVSMGYKGGRVGASIAINTMDQMK
ncbi:MAG: hypothetical protein H7A40_01530 [Chlamydiales bacterium]|nr:hypothetical protein [Chlamydiales bacterium]